MRRAQCRGNSDAFVNKLTPIMTAWSLGGNSTEVPLLRRHQRALVGSKEAKAVVIET